jgi:hypothetical protein
MWVLWLVIFLAVGTVMTMVLDRFFGRRAWVAALGIMVIGAVILWVTVKL